MPRRIVLSIYWDALNFRTPKIYAVPHRPAVFRFLSFSRHHCAVWRSVQYSALSFCSVTAHAHQKSRVRSNNTPTRNVYVTLVYLFLFAVVLLCCDMLWYNLLHWTSPRYALLIFADNTALPGFIIFLYMIYAIWWTLTHITRSYLFMNGWQTRTFSCSTHTEACAMSRWGHKHTNNISRTAHFMSDSQFHSSKTILISYTLRNVKIFTAARQNKIWPIQAHTYPSWYDSCPLFSPFEYIRHCFAYC